jgi:hypothetical protein
MEQLLTWLEESRVSVAIAGSSYLYPAILAAHGVGMSLVVGLNTAISLRILGVARSLPLSEIAKFSPVLWAGFWLNVASGVVLSAAAATRVMVDPVFYLKMVCVALAIVNLRLIQRELARDPERPSPAPLTAAVGTVAVTVTRQERRIKLLAAASMFLWGFAIIFGRLMGYRFFRFWE